MKKIHKILFVFLFVLTFFLVMPSSVFCHSAGDTVKFYNLTIGRYDENGNINFIRQKTANYNGKSLASLVKNNSKKTIILPKGTLNIDCALEVGDNTTIIAEGTTVYMTNPNKLIVNNKVDKTGYASTKNVTIKGGTWKIKDNEKAKRSTSTFRFAHASNINLLGCKIDTNYRSHAVELIACKNVTVDNCTLLAYGKQRKNSLEEALQIDLATKATAPNIAKRGSKYVKGQTCYNITVKNSTIRGSRGICANKTTTQKNKYIKKYHRNVTIINNNIIGTTSEAVALHNTAGMRVENNTITSKGKRLNSVYSIGLNIASFGKNNITRKYSNVIKNNTIKGGRQALLIYSYKGNKYGKTTIMNNKLYSKKGKKNAKKIKGCTKTVQKGNKLYKWR